MCIRKKYLLLTIAVTLLMLLSASSFADKYGFDEQRLEEDSDKCRDDPECMEAVKKYEAKKVAREQQGELQDQILKENDKFAYYTTIFGRILKAVLLVAVIIGVYSLLFSLF